MTPAISPIVRTAERRLIRLHVWAAIRQHVAIIAGAAAFAAALRPFVWPLQHQAPALSALRALVFAAAGAAVILVGILVRAWRTRPRALTAARRIDQALGLAEVVASGFAFERDARDDEMAAFAIRRGLCAVDDVDVARLFVPEKVTRPRFFRLMIAAAALALLFGAIDRLVVERAIHPVTEREARAAGALETAAAKAAAEAKADAKTPSTPEEQQMLAAAQRAAEAAQRGDRKAAMEALEDMKKAQRALEADDRDRAKSLRAIRDELESKQAGGKPGESAAEALAREAAGMNAADKEQMKKLAERLERAERAAREAASHARESGKPGEASGTERSAGEKGAWSRAAEALKEAREAAARGDGEAAQRAMARAQKEIAALEAQAKRSGKAGARSKLGDKAAALDKSLREGAEGKGEGQGKGKGEGEGEGKGKSESGKGKGKNGDGDADGDGEGDGKGQSPAPGGGGGAGDRDPVAPKERIKLNGDLQARADVREGEKAVSAIEGMGKGGDPKAYQEVFPSYDTVVEDGLREDNVPAARRGAVRRYFKSIRPGEEDSKAGKP